MRNNINKRLTVYGREVWRKVDENTIEADVWALDPPNLVEPWYTRQSYTKLDDPEHVFRINHWDCKGNQNNNVFLDEDGNSNFVDFDSTTGVVKEFQYTTPHSWLGGSTVLPREEVCPTVSMENK